MASKENTAARDGVPISEVAMVSVAALRLVIWLPSEADTSSTNAMSIPQAALNGGLVRDCCQTPPEASSGLPETVAGT